MDKIAIEEELLKKEHADMLTIREEKQKLKERILLADLYAQTGVWLQNRRINKKVRDKISEMDNTARSNFFKEIQKRIIDLIDSDTGSDYTLEAIDALQAKIYKDLILMDKTQKED